MKRTLRGYEKWCELRPKESWERCVFYGIEDGALLYYNVYKFYPGDCAFVFSNIVGSAFTYSEADMSMLRHTVLSDLAVRSRFLYFVESCIDEFALVCPKGWSVTLPKSIDEIKFSASNVFQMPSVAGYFYEYAALYKGKAKDFPFFLHKVSLLIGQHFKINLGKDFIQRYGYFIRVCRSKGVRVGQYIDDRGRKRYGICK